MDTSGLGTLSRRLVSSSVDLFFRTDGSDSNDGFADSPSRACQNPQEMIDAIAATMDFNGNTINLRQGVNDVPGNNEGTRPIERFGTISIPTLATGGSLNIFGNPNPAYKTTFNGGVADCFILWGTGQVNIGWGDLRLTSAGGSGLINVVNQSIGQLYPGVDFGPGFSSHVFLHDKLGKFMMLNQLYTISGDVRNHVIINQGELIIENCVGTPVGSISMAAFVSALAQGTVQTTGSSWPTSGGNNFSGVRYNAGGALRFTTSGGGKINANGANRDTYFPGGQAGQAENFNDWF